MRIYVAGSTREKNRVRAMQKLLMHCGHSISYDWTGPQEQWRDNPSTYGKSMAVSEMEGVNTADGLVLLIPRADGSTLDEGKGSKLLRGAWVELGGAAFAGKKCVVVSETEGKDCLFCCLPNVFWTDAEEKVPAFYSSC